ncbi:MAG: MFS transporter, partial [Bacteroidota bacterium]|nr:MFS transporter [Bacteroidota bacterium]
YALFSLMDKETQKKGKIISGLAIAAALGVLYYKSTIVTGSVHVSAPIFQQFNPFYVVALTPVSLAIFGGLAKKGKEPSAPRKIAYGMLVAACAFGIMAFASLGLNTPNKQRELDNAVKAKTELLAAEKQKAENAQPVATEDYKEETMVLEEIDGEFIVTEETPAAEPAVDVTVTEEAIDEAPVEIIDRDAIIAAGDAAEKDLTFASPFVLVLIYLILTFGELLLSPMGISFVSKVAPPKYKGMMMGGWFVATAIGNLLVSVGGFLWGGLPLWSVWCVFLTLCLLSAAFMFIMMKKLEDATK